MSEIKIIGNWIDELMTAPDQCSLNIKYKGNFYVLYLRSRFRPWTAELIITDETFNISDSYIWIDLDIPNFNEGTDKLEEIKQAAFDAVVRHFNINTKN